MKILENGFEIMSNAHHTNNVPNTNIILEIGNIVVLNLPSGSYVIRIADLDLEWMKESIYIARMRFASKDEREYWCHGYVEADVYALHLRGLSEWVKWRDT
jgi:hypothetical protein